MRRILKAFLIMILFGTVTVTPVAAQGYPVIDVANLMQAINTLYATYDQITATIEQVQNTYQQLQKQIEMVATMDWEKVGEKISDMDVTSVEGILNLRHQIKDVTKLVNANMNLINNVQDTLTKKTMTFGGKRYTIGGLFGFGKGDDETTIFDLPKNVVDYVGETADDVVAGYAGKLTYKQKEAIMRRTGLSPRNYAKVHFVEEQMNTLIKDMFTTGTDENMAAILSRAGENQEGVAAMMEAAGESMVNQQQATTTAILEISTGITRLEAGVGRLAGFMAQKEISEQIKRETDADLREEKELNRKNEKIKRSGLPAGF
ncbi:MAG: hypothetical protein LBT16_12360 [Treponema sp.]|nr:hypothetical protein [Treponema sp.]